MITYDYGGQLGNQLFQYVIARLLAERLGFELVTTLRPSETITVTPPAPGKRFENDKTTIVETADMRDLLTRQYNNRHYHLQGYWQVSGYYLPNRAKILGYFNEKAPAQTNTQDIVMHVRLRDYKQFGKGGSVLHPSYYIDALKKHNFDKLYILTDEPEDVTYLGNFRRFNPLIRRMSEREDFWFMTGFDRIIMGNSTFSWWAAFLSNARTVYAPACWIRNSYDIYHDLQNITNGEILPAGFIDYNLESNTYGTIV